MKALISHDTALAYWRLHFPLDSSLGDPALFSEAEAFASRKEDVLGSVPEFILDPDRPADILVPNANFRRGSARVAPHVWSSSYPDGSFYKIGEAYVSSPEFLFLQMASQLSIVQLAALGCELCGTYVLLPQGVKHPGSLDELPKRASSLSSLEALTAFVRAAKGSRGKSKALRALNYVVDGSRSPMETMTCLLLCLSPMLGGYGLPLPKMNEVIELDEEGRKIARRRHCEGDLCWRAGKLDIEYHGEVHVGKLQMKSDVGRTLGIEHMDWKVITVTSPQVLDIDQFEVVAKEAAKRLGRRLHPRIVGRTLARQIAHDDLSDWMGLPR